MYSGFEDNITKQRTESEREYEEAENLKSEKLKELNAELEQTLSKVTQLADELDHKQLEESVISVFWAFFSSKKLKMKSHPQRSFNSKRTMVNSLK